MIVSIFLTFLFGCSIEQKIPSDNKPSNLPRVEGENIQANSETLEVHYIDVGQGESILVKLPNSQTLLIDAGGNSVADKVVQYLKSQDITKLDHLVGTHPHEDHIGGLDVVIDSFTIGKVYLPRVSHNTKSFEDLLLAIKGKGLKVTEAKSGVEIDIGEEAEAIFVAPNNSNYQNLNDYSGVIRLTYGKTSFLFTGDAEKKSEEEILLKYQTQLKSNVLNVGHHGSITSTSQPFLDGVSPEYAIISLGKDNTYGHPHEEIIERLEAKGIQYFRTDLEGTIIATSTGQEISFSNELGQVISRLP